MKVFPEAMRLGLLSDRLTFFRHFSRCVFIFSLDIYLRVTIFRGLFGHVTFCLTTTVGQKTKVGSGGDFCPSFFVSRKMFFVFCLMSFVRVKDYKITHRSDFCEIYFIFCLLSRAFGSDVRRLAQPVWRSGQSVGLGIERSRVRNSPVPSGFSLRQGN